MTVLRAPFSAELPGPDAGLSRSLSSVVTLRFQVSSATSWVKALLSLESHRVPPHLLAQTLGTARSPKKDHSIPIDSSGSVQ